MLAICTNDKEGGGLIFADTHAEVVELLASLEQYKGHVYVRGGIAGDVKGLMPLPTSIPVRMEHLVV